MFEQLPQLLLEGVDWTATAEATPKHVSDLPEIHRLNQAFRRLGNLMPSKKKLAQINTRHILNVLHSITMHLITNHSHKSATFPKTYMSPPKSRLEMKINHHLIHFHHGFVSQEGLNGVTLDLEKVRTIFRKENGLPKYVAFKRAFAGTNQALADNFKGG